MRPPYTCLYRETWNDRRFLDLSDGAKLAYLYVLSTPLGNGIGCFKAGIGAMEEDSYLESFRESFAESLAQSLFEYDPVSRVVLIPRYFVRNYPNNGNVIKSMGKEFARVPDCDLKERCYHIIREWCEERKESFMESFTESFGESYPKRPGTDPYSLSPSDPLSDPPSNTYTYSPSDPRSPSRLSPGRVDNRTEDEIIADNQAALLEKRRQQTEF